MTFLSYAQNFEDVMLWRALKHVEKGFYIDVGANDPTIDSVTKAFYDRGWSGINIEPLPIHHADLERERPRDVNLECAAGASAGEVEIWECDVRGWATSSSDTISQHSRDGHVGTFQKVTVKPLQDICAEHVSGDIHFLKIDVEGFEKNVIEGINFSLYRPWILVIEATKPNSTEEIHVAWEEIVLSSKYVLAYMDGLNRFYVAEERQYLLKYFQYPPNVFDNFMLGAQHEAETKAQEAETKAQEAETKAQEAETKAQEAETKAQEAETKAQEALTEMRAINKSKIWRITAPLRKLEQFFLSFRP
jgi:FkbM family methyltransferase